MDTILLVDPYPIVTYGLGKVLEDADIRHPVVRAHNMSQAQQAMSNKLALLILDPSMSDTSPDMFVVQARRKHPDLPILFFSSPPHGIHLTLAQMLGINGYLDKTSDLTTLTAAIRMVLSGMQCFPRRNGYSTTEGAALQKLTPRELVILQFLRQGLRNKDIAQRLYLSPKTVSTHRRSLLRKLGTDEVVPRTLEGLSVVGENMTEVDMDGARQQE